MVDPSTPAARNQIIDAFRGVAIIAVIAFHFSVRWAPPFEPNDLYGYGFTFPHWLQVGAYGVQLFFVISGLVITMTLLRSADALEFAVKRFARIYPAFALSVVLTYVVTQFGPPELRVGFADFLANFAVNAHFFGFKPVDGVYWTLAVELKFYAIVALARWIWQDNYWIALLIVALASGAASFVHMDLSVTLLGPYWPFFLFGIAAWLWIFERQHVRAASLAAASACLYLTMYGAIHRLGLPTLLVDVSVIGSAAVMIILLRWFPGVSVPVLAPIGRISYSLYLIHQNIGVCIIGWLTAGGLSGGLALAIATTLILGLATLLFVLVEQPGNRAVMRAYHAAARSSRQAAGLLT